MKKPSLIKPEAKVKGGSKAAMSNLLSLRRGCEMPDEQARKPVFFDSRILHLEH